METVDRNTPETKIYNKLWDLGHDTQKSIIKLLHAIADIQRLPAEERIVRIQAIQPGSQPLSTLDPSELPVLQQLVSKVNGFKTKLDGMLTKLNLEKNYIGNVKNYAQTVNRQYITFQDSNNKLISKQKQSDQIFLRVINSMKNLYPCFFKMEQITRYPLEEFSYGNLDLLANQKQACDQIDKMLGAFFSILKPYLTEYQPDTNPKL